MKQQLYDFVKEKSLNYDKLENVKKYQTWDYHILPTVKNAIMLGKLYGADLEVVEIAALFHDYSIFVDFHKYNETHHIASGVLAEPILLKAGYKQDFVDKVKRAIKSHRASVPLNKGTIEQIVLADADAMAHIENAFEIIMWRGYRGDDIMDANAFIKKKLTKSYAKMSDKTKELARDKFEAIMKILY